MPSKTCVGERCHCGQPAAKKVGEEIPFDDPEPNRHNLTAYVCAQHYAELMGPVGASQVASTPQEPDDALIEAETYRQMHETARELGYPSILEALEALSRLQAPPVADDDAEWLLNYADSVLDGSVMGVREAKRLKEIAARIQVSNGALHRISEMTDIEADFDGFEAREIANSSLQAKAPETPYSGIVVVDEADFTPGGIVEEGEG